MCSGLGDSSRVDGRSGRRRRVAGRHRRTSASAGRPLVVVGLLLAACGAAMLLWPPDTVTGDVGSVLAVSSAADRDVRLLVPPSLASRPEAPPRPPLTADRSFAPSRLFVDDVRIDAGLVAVSVDSNSALVPPEDPAELGWWRGVRPGAGAGSVIIAGHLDSRRYGRGPLAALVDLVPGTRAVLSNADGSSAAYVLRGVQTFPKDALPAAELFGHEGPERLVLVTCGGSFDPRRAGWDSNVVAVLDPLPG